MLLTMLIKFSLKPKKEKAEEYNKCVPHLARKLEFSLLLEKKEEQRGFLSNYTNEATSNYCLLCVAIGPSDGHARLSRTISPLAINWAIPVLIVSLDCFLHRAVMLQI